MRQTITVNGHTCDITADAKDDALGYPCWAACWRHINPFECNNDNFNAVRSSTCGQPNNRFEVQNIKELCRYTGRHSDQTNIHFGEAVQVCQDNPGPCTFSFSQRVSPSCGTNFIGRFRNAHTGFQGLEGGVLTGYSYPFGSIAPTEPTLMKWRQMMVTVLSEAWFYAFQHGYDTNSDQILDCCCSNLEITDSGAGDSFVLDAQTLYGGDVGSDSWNSESDDLADSCIKAQFRRVRVNRNDHDDDNLKNRRYWTGINDVCAEGAYYLAGNARSDGTNEYLNPRQSPFGHDGTSTSVNANNVNTHPDFITMHKVWTDHNNENDLADTKFASDKSRNDEDCWVTDEWTNWIDYIDGWTGSPHLGRLENLKCGDRVSDTFVLCDYIQATADSAVDSCNNVWLKGERIQPDDNNNNNNGGLGGGGRRLYETTTNDDQPYSQFPGGASAGVELASAKQIRLADFNGDGKLDILVHASAPSAGSCAQRCHAQGRFGYDSFQVHHVSRLAAAEPDEPSFCYCGPAYGVMDAP